MTISPAGKSRVEKAPIHHLRKLRGMTLEELADEIGIHPVSLSRFENYRRMPSIEVAGKIAAVLGKTAGEVIDDYQRHVEPERKAVAS